MKKFTAVMVVGLIFIAGAACGGGSSWSDADKAQLAQGKTLAITLGVMTEKQAECYGNWIQSHYDSMAQATADESDREAQASLNKACKIAGVTSEKKVTTTTTNDSVKISLCIETMDSVTEGLNVISENIGTAVSSDGATAREFVRTSREFVSTSIEAVQLCAGYAPTEAAIALNWLEKLDESLINLEDLI